MKDTQIGKILYLEITPDIAKEFLEHNINNRPVNFDRVLLLKDIILKNEWNPKKGYIEFSAEGQLLNGQHRLHAIILSGQTVTARVLRFSS